MILDDDKTCITALEIIEKQAGELSKYAAGFVVKDTENAHLRIENQNLKAENFWLKEQFHLAKAREFGPSSERAEAPSELALVFDEAEATAEENEPEPTIETAVSAPRRKKKKGHKERQLKNLEIKEEHHELPEDEQICPQCGEKLHDMGCDDRDEIVVVPAQFIHVIHHQHKYACRHCQSEEISTPIVAAKAPKPVIVKSIASAAILAWIAYRKFVEAMPLYRQQVSLSREGIEISRQTMANWMIQSSDILSPVYQKLREKLLESEIIRADETTVQVLNEPGKSPESNSYMWHYGSALDGVSISLFEYQASRSSEHPKAFLKDFKGFLQVDAYAGYNCLVPDVTLAGCWAHARRKFVDAVKTLPAAAKKKGGSNAHIGIDYIDKLYSVEHEIKGKSPQEILEARQTKSKAILAKFKVWLEAKAAESAPKSCFGIAVNYCLHQWAKLIVYLTDPRLEIDNNRAERSIKPFVVGRKNWLFANTPKGAKASAIIYSLVETAKENGLHPQRYLERLLETISQRSDDDPIDDLLPWSPEIQASCKSATNST
jgi:transposase